MNDDLNSIKNSESYADDFKRSFPDAKKLTSKQRKALLLMLHDALVELRSHGILQKSEQAGDLANAFHNLPLWLNMEIFSFNHFRDYLNSYYRKHPEFIYNYSDMLNKIEKDEGE